MVGYYYKTGAEIHEIICFMEEKLKLSCVTSPSSLKTGQTYGWKPYRFSFFLNAQNKFVYLIEPLANDETDYEQLAKRCQSKEEKEMTKEEALKKIEELKEYVEKCEEKEKEIPRMHRGVLPKAQPAIVCPWMKCEDVPLWWKEVTEWMTFNEDDTFLTWGILAYELAQLMYAREYLKIDVKECLNAHEYGDGVFKLVYDITECEYVTVSVPRYQVLNERDYVWCFTNKDAANRIRDYMNKYAAHVKKNMF